MKHTIEFQTSEENLLSSPVCWSLIWLRFLVSAFLLHIWLSSRVQRLYQDLVQHFQFLMHHYSYYRHFHHYDQLIQYLSSSFYHVLLYKGNMINSKNMTSDWNYIHNPQNSNSAKLKLKKKTWKTRFIRAKTWNTQAKVKLDTCLNDETRPR